MKRQTASVRSMVYQYGTVPARVAPVQGEDEALRQMCLARRLWNLLVAIEHVRINNYRRIMHDEVQTEIDGLRECKRALDEERRALRKKARTNVPTPELDAELVRIDGAIKMLVEHQKSTKKERHDARCDQLTALAQHTFRRVKLARQAAAGLRLFWGTYNAVIQSFETGRQLGGDLKFRSFRGEGTLTAQVMGGANVAECVGGNHKFFQVEKSASGQRWRYASIRIGSTANRAPIWLSIPIVYHREIPGEARIKSVSATLRIVAGKVRWSLNVTVTLPPIVQKPATGRAVAIDIGWRLLPEGVRIGYWRDDGGDHGEIRIPRKGKMLEHAETMGDRPMRSERPWQDVTANSGPV